MAIDALLDAVRDRLDGLAAVSDETTVRTVEAVGRAVEDALRVGVLDLFGQLAADLSEQLEEQRVEVHLDGREPSLVVVGAGSPPPATATDDLSARITLRLPEGLKDAITEAAERDGTSVNAWVVRALSGALARPRRATVRAGNRLSGYARS